MTLLDIPNNDSMKKDFYKPYWKLLFMDGVSILANWVKLPLTSKIKEQATQMKMNNFGLF